MKSSLALPNNPWAVSYTQACVAVLAIAMVLRLLGLGAESAWIDEAYSIKLAERTVPEIIAGTAADQHPPFYYLLLHFWIQLASGIAFARLLSVIIGVVQIGQSMVLANRLAGPTASLVLGALLALSPVHLWYSQEARMYILLAALTTAATSELWSLLQGHGRWSLYGFYSALSLYTHYFAAFVFLAHALVVLTWVYQHKNLKLLWKWILAVSLVGLSFLPWLPVAINQTRYHTMSWIQSPSAAEIRDTILRLLLGGAPLILPQTLRWILLAGVILALVRPFALSFRRSPDRDRSMGFASIWFWAPFLAVTIVSLVYPIFQFKQFLIVLVPLLLLAVASALTLPRRVRGLILVGILLSSGASMLNQQALLTKDDWRGAAGYLQSNFQADDVIYTNPAAAELALTLYMESDNPMEGYPPEYDIVSGGWNAAQITPETAHRELETAFADHNRLWLVEFSPEFWDPSGVLVHDLETRARQLDERWYGKIRIRLFQNES